MKKLVATLTVAGTLISSPIISKAALGDQSLKSGMNHNDVKQLQENLKQKGYFKYASTTTYFGSYTKQAVISFQKANGLEADGIVGPATFRALKVSGEENNTTQIISENSTDTTSGQTLKYGMTHSEVKRLQEILKQKGYFTYSETTTYFGNYTRQAVVNFQRANGLKTDGVVGSDTWRALGVAGSNSSPVTSNSKPATNVQGVSSYNPSVLINTGKKYLGVRYVWGGTSPSGFDCSGFLNYAYKEALGIQLPRTVEGIYKVGTPVSAPSIGDLVFFETYKPGASHAGIYLGNGQFLHSSSSKGVAISDMSNSYWSKRYLGAKKIGMN